MLTTAFSNVVDFLQIIYRKLNENASYVSYEIEKLDYSW